MYFVYILECNNGSYYTGITTDVTRRFKEHLEDKIKGAKYTRVNKPIRVVYEESCKDRSVASKRECAIKKLSRKEKEYLIKSLCD
jgi:putative endonuclease